MTDADPQSESIFAASRGGVTIETQRDVSIGGDVVGRDKITLGYTVEQVSTLLTQITSTFQPQPFDGRCPYRGLDVFEEEDADLFFGRERLIGDLVKRVQHSRSVFITGPSGSGKSSLVRAGLIHALRQGGLPDSERWLYEALKPGRNPIDEVARVVSSLAGSLSAGDDLRARWQTDATLLARWVEVVLKDQRERRAVIFVDQFEEVFTQTTKEAERLAFLNLLTQAAIAEDGRTIVLFAMRSDFVSNCATYPDLNALLNRQFLQIGAMQPDELVSAIAQPALRVGLRIDPDLIAQIIEDMEGEPGALPLMQFALKDLFDAQRERGGAMALTRQDYVARGGIHKALERHADMSFAQLSEQEQAITRQIFSGLIQVGRGVHDTRRTAVLNELVPAGIEPESVEGVVQKLADARLVTTDETDGHDIVTISHEKLIDAWPWLKRLVNENREAIALQNDIAEDAQAWAENHRDPSYLYTGARLASAREQLTAKKIVLSGLAQAYVEAGVAAEEAERQREEARRQKELDDTRKLAEAEGKRAEDQAQAAAKLRRRAMYLIGALGIALVLGIVAGVFGLQSNQNAVTARRNAATAEAASTLAVANAGTAQAASTKAVSEANTRAVAEAEAVKQRDEAQRQARLALSRQLASQALNELDRQMDLSLLLSLEALRAEDTPAARGSLLTALLKSPRLRTYLHAENTGAAPLAFSATGRWLATGGDGNAVVLYELAESDEPKRIGSPLHQHRDTVASVAFSSDDRWLAAGGRDGAVYVWDISQPETPVPYTLTVSSSATRSLVAFQRSTPIAAVVTNGGNITFWEVAEPERFRQVGSLPQAYRGGVSEFAFSADDQVLAVATGSDVHLWEVADLQSPQLRKTLSFGGGANLLSLAFGGSGRLLAMAFSVGNIQLWDLTEPATPVGSQQSFRGSAVAFSDDGRLLAVAEGGQIVLRDMTNLQAPSTLGQPLIGNNEPAYSLAFNPAGSLLAGSRGGDVVIWDTARSARWPIELNAVPTQFTPAMTVSPDQRLLATGQPDRTVLWDLSDSPRPVELFVLPTELGGPTGLSFDAAGQTLAIAGSEGTELWDISNRREPVRISDDWPAQADITFSPSEPILVGGNRDWLTIWDVSDVNQPRILTQTLSPGLGILSLAFRPDGRVLASGSRDGSIVLWDLSQPDTPVPSGPPVAAHPANVSDLMFSPNGRYLTSAMGDPFASNTIRLWDVVQPEAPQALGTAIEGVFNTAFSPDGRTLLTEDHILWDVSDLRLPIQLGRLPPGQISASFGAKGDILITYSEPAGLVVWDLRVESWRTQACRIAQRQLSQAEWLRYIGEAPYRRTCDEAAKEK